MNINIKRIRLKPNSDIGGQSLQTLKIMQTSYVKSEIKFFYGNIWPLRPPIPLCQYSISFIHR